jgi:hypothetical protein
VGLLCNLNHKIKSNTCNEASRTHVTTIQTFSQKHNSFISNCAAHLLVQEAQLNAALLLLFTTYSGMQRDAGRC